MGEHLFAAHRSRLCDALPVVAQRRIRLGSLRRLYFYESQMSSAFLVGFSVYVLRQAIVIRLVAWPKAGQTA